ncbi:MAG: phosphohistidine phosphatase SixA [Candidatus Aminicenantes bacterium]|nr:phosphohistidine phosphatase SixA [Candidatus Aminicenantes bacterium]
MFVISITIINSNQSYVEEVLLYLFLIQHGKTIPKDKDPERPLNIQGKKHTKRAASFLRSHGFLVEEIWHSDKLRAKQTAEIIGKKLFCKNIKERDDLGPLDPVKKIADQVQKQDENLMISGHLPFLEKLAAQLLTGVQKKPIVKFQNSGIVCLEKDKDWSLVWSVIPNII